MLFLARDTSIPQSMPLISDSACAMEAVKLYFYNYNIRATRVDSIRHLASALEDAVLQGMSAKESKITAKQAQIEWRMLVKLAKLEASRIICPIISSGWNFFEAICNDDTIAEGFPRGTGTVFGSYGGGFLDELRLGRVCYLVLRFSSGSWVGGRIGVQS